MFIKQLEIFGFKSFKERTVLHFEAQDITGIVGPNGCGKSNILDAFLWVMGENSPKNLRGENLSDIIFSGTSNEASGHLAEVKLILNPGQRGFPVKYEKFSEIMISRRSYREGKNECFINNEECLLREIREFFMNTGAGCRGFSVIEQESIERLITAKPLQRRYIIEEAAGITKFKNQKAESLRKLQLVGHNLKRLEDILKIQAHQLSHLKSQSKKAEKYKKLKQEIELRNKQIHGLNYKSFIENQKNFQRDIENKFKQKKEIDQVLSDEKENFQNLGNQIKESEKQIENLKEMLSEKKIEEVRLKDQIKNFERIEDKINQKKDQVNIEKKDIQKKLLKFEDSFKQNYTFPYIQKEFLRVKSKLDEIKQNKNSLQVQIDLLIKQIEFVKKEKESISLEEKNLSESIKQNINKKNKHKEIIKKELSQRIILEEKLIEVSQKEKDLKTKREDLENILSELRPKVKVLIHKVEEMNKILLHFSNLNQGAKDLIKWQPEQFHSLFEKLNVEPKYAKALSVVLGPFIQAVIPEEMFDLERGIERLKANKNGKSWFLTRLSKSENLSSLKNQLKYYPSVIGFLDEKIHWNRLNSNLKPLLEKTVLVSNFKSALEIKQNFSNFQFVTLEGDFITENSFIYAGSQDQTNSLFEIRNQVKDSIKQLSLEKTKLQSKEMMWSNCLKQMKDLKEQRENLEKRILSSSELSNMSQRELEYLEKDLKRLIENRDKNREKIKDFQQKQEGLLEHTVLFNEDIDKQEKDISYKQAYLELLDLAFENIKLQEIKKNQKEKKELETQFGLFYKDWKSLCEIKEQKEKDIKVLEQTLVQIQMDIKTLQFEKDKKDIEKTHLQETFKKSHQMNIEEFDLNINLDMSLEELNKQLSVFQEQLERIKEVNFLALGEYEKLSQEYEFLTQQKEELLSSQKGIMKIINHIDKTCKNRFHTMLEEVNKRFSKVFPVIFQGDNAKAELILHEENGEQGVDIKVHPPGKKPQSVSLLSRGEKALTSICLIYSLFLVKPSPFCIIDEADAPLDDANIFRFLSVIKEMSQTSQILVITHNKYTMQNCDKLYGVTQKQAGISQIVSVDMRRPLIGN
ncbi:MAG: AAA family ATPase [Bdellovibrionales bacterium]|nr:AAA family ATPase [Bdellovibrionales bacterium]